MTFAADRPVVPAGPAPASRKNVDSVPDHLWSDDAVRCRSAGYGGGGFGGGGRIRYKGGTYGDYTYGGGGGGAGGGGWGMGFRIKSGEYGGGGAAGVRGGAADVTAAVKDAFGHAHDGRVTALRCTPDGLFLVSAGTDNRVRLWDLATGRNTDAAYGQVRM